MSYTNLGKTATPPTNTYKNMVITNRTAGERSTFQSSLGSEPFCTFKWRGFDAWQNFGAFIINSGDSLYFYNGPSYKNSYVQPQFTDSNKILEGISFEQQTISFTIGVFWITEDNYRYLLDWLNPYEKNTLSFGYNAEYCYDVKLAGIKDTTRRFLGYDSGNNRAYYTEFQLTFDVLGTACARSINAVINTPVYASEATYFNTDAVRYLKTPITATISSIAMSANVEYVFEYYDDYGTSNTTLFSLTPNITLTGNEIISYDSEDSLLYYQSTSTATKELLSCSIYNSSGIRVFKDFEVNQFFLRGKFDQNYPNLTFCFFNFYTISGSTKTPVSCVKSISCYPRTNII